VKVAWFRGDVEVPEAWAKGVYMSMDEIIALPQGDERSPELELLLVPDDFDLSLMRGDDWNDAPADCNAGMPYEDSLPPGAVWIRLRLNDVVDINVHERGG
jgi:hypothetical protein